MKKENKNYTTRELANRFNLKPSIIQYYRNEGIIPSIRRGKGFPSLYPPEALEIIQERQNQFQNDVE